jgi:hypothetical protein
MDECLPAPRPERRPLTLSNSGRVPEHPRHKTSGNDLRNRKLKNTNTLNCHGLSPRANYTDRATAACWRNDCQLFADRGCHVVSVTDPNGRILRFLDRSSYFSIKLLLSCTHEAEWTPVPDPQIFFPDSAGNRTRATGLWPLDHRGGLKNTNTIHIL